MHRNFCVRAILIGIIAIALPLVGCKVIGDEPKSDQSAGGKQRVEVNALPINVTAAVKGLLPNGEIRSAQTETRKNKMVYNLDVKDRERKYHLVVAPDGQVLSTKEEGR